MPSLKNTGQGLLLLSDGQSLEPGASVEVDTSLLAHPVIAAWIECGMASASMPEATPQPVEPAPKPSPTFNRKVGRK